MFKKTGLVSLLLVIMSIVALGQEGQWRHFAQINPDTIQATSIEIISTNNQLWSFWLEGHVYSDTVEMLISSKYDGHNWEIVKIDDACWYNDADLIKAGKDNFGRAYLYFYYGTILPKYNTNKLNEYGVYKSFCNEVETNWSDLSLCYSWSGALNMDLAISKNDRVYIISEQHMHISTGQGSGIYSTCYDTNWTQVVEASYDDATEINHYRPSITIDKNDSVWKGWCTYQQLGTTYHHKLNVNNQIIDFTENLFFSNLQLVTDSLNKVWAFYTTDSIRHMVNDSGAWRTSVSLGVGGSLLSVVDKKGYVWLVCQRDSIIYLNYFAQSGWNNWDSITIGTVKNISLDQMGNPCLAWYHDKKIYSAIYCRDTIAPWVQITSPVADSTYYKGQTVQVQFSHSNDVAFLNVYCQKEGQSEWQNIFDMISKDSLVNWTVPDDSANYRFRAEAIDSGWNEAVDSTGWFLVSPQGLAGKPSDTSTNFKFALNLHGPNPFRQNIDIAFAVDKPCNADLSIYNSLGQLVKVLYNDRTVPGNYKLQWNGCDAAGKKAAAGVYFCRLSDGSRNSNIKLIKVN